MNRKFTIGDWFARETKRLGRPLRKSEFGKQCGLSATVIVRIFNGQDKRILRVEDNGDGTVTLWQKNPPWSPVRTKNTAGYKTMPEG